MYLIVKICKINGVVVDKPELSLCTYMGGGLNFLIFFVANFYRTDNPVYLFSYLFNYYI